MALETIRRLLIKTPSYTTWTFYITIKDPIYKKVQVINVRDSASGEEQ